MQFVFWQNIISIHQSAFLRNLAEYHKVILVFEKEVSSDRQLQGWSLPDMGKVIFINAPNKDHILSILQKEKKAWHIFSGFGDIKTIFDAFKIAIKLKCKIAIMAEPFRWFGLKGKIRYGKYMFFRLLYGRGVKFLLITGEKGIRCYKRAGFSGAKIFDWGYFTESGLTQNNLDLEPANTSSLPNLLFVGQLNARKNIIALTEICKRNKLLFNSFTIIGSGPYKEKLVEIIQDIPNISYKGVLPNYEVAKLMQKADLLILPSIFDGWGAVVNEALQNGTRVIVSENCGAAALLDGKTRGEIFFFSGDNNLEVVLKRWILKGKISQVEREEIVNWSSKNISGEAAATYFMEIINFVQKETTSRPQAPWLNQNNPKQV